MQEIRQNSTNGSREQEPKCPYCSRRFSSPDELTLHIVTRHTQVGIRRGPAQAGNGK